MTTMNRVMMRWKDDFLKWDNDASLKGVNSIQVKQEDIWVPDITVGNIVLENWHMGFVEHCGVLLFVFTDKWDATYLTASS